MAANSKPVKAVFFDLGYTLIYFSGDFLKETFTSYLILADELIQAGCELDRQNFAAEFEKRIHQYFAQRSQDYLERPIIDILRAILTDAGENRYSDAVYLKCMEAMYRFTERLWLIEEDTHDLLNWLVEHDYRLGLISNASSAWDVNNLIDNHHLRPYFSTILISASEGIRKPDPAIFRRAAERMHGGRHPGCRHSGRSLRRHSRHLDFAAQRSGTRSDRSLREYASRRRNSFFA